MRRTFFSTTFKESIELEELHKRYFENKMRGIGLLVAVALVCFVSGCARTRHALAKLPIMTKGPIGFYHES